MSTILRIFGVALAAGLFVALLALGPKAMVGPGGSGVGMLMSKSGTPTPPPSCATPATPTVASNAGLTLLIYNADFSCSAYATQTSPGYTNQANGWLGCYEADTNMHELWQAANSDVSSNPPPPCNAVIPGVNDGNNTVLQLHWQSSYCTSTGCRDGGTGPRSYNILQTFSESFSPGGTKQFFDLPQDYYIEFAMRISASPVPGCTDAADLSGMFGFTHWPSAHGFDPIEAEPGLLGVVNGPCPTGTDNTDYINNWGNGENPNTQFNGFPSMDANYHTHGMMFTTNTTTQWVCAWLDSALQGSCINALMTTTQQPYRRYFGIQAGQTGATWETYLKYIRIWTRCSTWATTECPGSTLFNSGGLTYYH